MNEHSQAYYVIKAAQEKEELQRKEDELKAKILKSEKELTSLVNTLTHLNTRNSNYRDYFINKGATKMDVEQQNSLEEQCKDASDKLMKKRKNLDVINRKIEENGQLFEEVQQTFKIMKFQNDKVAEQNMKLDEELEKQNKKMIRADKFYQKALTGVRQKNVGDIGSSFQITQASLDQQQKLTKTLFSIIH